DQLVAFGAVVAEQRLDVLERRRLERLEAVVLVDLADDVDHVLPPADVVRKKVAGPARRLCTARHLVVYRSPRGRPERPALHVPVRSVRPAHPAPTLPAHVIQPVADVAIGVLL